MKTTWTSFSRGDMKVQTIGHLFWRRTIIGYNRGEEMRVVIVNPWNGKTTELEWKYRGSQLHLKR